MINPTIPLANLDQNQQKVSKDQSETDVVHH
jgi:hypothetical protein